METEGWRRTEIEGEKGGGREGEIGGGRVGERERERERRCYAVGFEDEGVDKLQKLQKARSRLCPGASKRKSAHSDF